MDTTQAVDAARRLAGTLRERGMDEEAVVVDTLRRTIALQRAVTGGRSDGGTEIRVVAWDGVPYAVGDRVGIVVGEHEDGMWRGEIRRFLLTPPDGVGVMGGPVYAETTVDGSTQRGFARLDELRKLVTT